MTTALHILGASGFAAALFLAVRDSYRSQRAVVVRRPAEDVASERRIRKFVAMKRDARRDSRPPRGWA